VELEQAIVETLVQHPRGLSEYELIKLMQQEPYLLFNTNALAQPLSLFQAHFVLFHCLYQLRANYRKNGQADLYISASKIMLLPYATGTNELSQEDSLSRYYLDWNNFRNTQQAEIEELLAQFWSNMHSGNKRKPDMQSVQQAYVYFDLALDSSLSMVKARYRHLQHQVHPDKGGDKCQSQLIEQHYQNLKKYLA
jgi:hypothetical protein